MSFSDSQGDFARHGDGGNHAPAAAAMLDETAAVRVRDAYLGRGLPAGQPG
jgi:hypothetical protein